MQLANRDKAAEVATLIDGTQADYFLGPLAAEQKTRDGLGNNSVSHLRTSAQEKEWQKTGESRPMFPWRNGFIYAGPLSHDHDIYFEADWKGKTRRRPRPGAAPSVGPLHRRSSRSRPTVIPTRATSRTSSTCSAKKALAPTTAQDHVRRPRRSDQLAPHRQPLEAVEGGLVPNLKITRSRERRRSTLGKIEAPNLEPRRSSSPVA